MATDFKGVELLKIDGTKAKGEVALKDKIVAVFFSAYFSRPCKEFTSVLKDFYDDMKKSGQPFDVVYVSIDRTPEEAKDFMEELHGDWWFLEVHSENGSKKKDEYKVKWNIVGIPAVVVVKANGNVINPNAVEEVESSQGDKTPAQIFEQWKAAK